MRPQLFIDRLRALYCAGLFAGVLTASYCAAADASVDAWPERPIPPLPQVQSPGEQQLGSPDLPPVSAGTTTTAPSTLLPPTQAVPPGVRPLLGPPVTVSPQNSSFEVDAPDFDSAYRVLGMTERIKSITARFFTWPDKPPGRIQIQLIPAAKADFTGPFVIKPGNNGQPTVLVRWNGDTQLSDVCQALSSVTLQNIVYWNDGAAAHVPDWLMLGFGVTLEAGFKPAMMDAFYDRANHSMLAMRQIMTPRGVTGPDAGVLGVNAFWLILFLADNSANSNVTHSLFDALAAGLDPYTLLAMAYPEKFEDPRDLELWWQVGYRDELATRSPPTQTMARTHALLDQLERVELTSEKGPRMARLDEAWAGRADKDRRDAIAQTLVNMRVTALQANPAYNNALVSLLLALKDMRDDDEKAFQRDWAQYLSDRAAGEAIENTTNAALSEGK